MHLSPKEVDRLHLFLAAELARRRRARGLRLNYPEARALIADDVCEGARDGKSVAELMGYGASVLTTDDVLPGVAKLVGTLQVADTGVQEGDWILIETPIGAVRQQVRVTDQLAPRVVQADRWWYPEQGDGGEDPFGFWSTNINVCTDNDTGSCDPIMGTWLLRGLPCRLNPE